MPPISASPSWRPHAMVSILNGHGHGHGHVSKVCVPPVSSVVHELMHREITNTDDDGILLSLDGDGLVIVNIE